MTPDQRKGLVALLQWATGVDDIAWEYGADAYRAEVAGTISLVSTRAPAMTGRRFDTEDLTVSYRQEILTTTDLRLEGTLGSMATHDAAALAVTRLASDAQPVLDAAALGIDIIGVPAMSPTQGVSVNGIQMETTVLSMEVAFGFLDVDRSAAAGYTIDQVVAATGTYTAPDGNTQTTVDTIPEEIPS